jgi:hypothetical protein
MLVTYLYNVLYIYISLYFKKKSDTCASHSSMTLFYTIRLGEVSLLRRG